MYFLHKRMTSCPYFTKGRQKCTRTFRPLRVDIRFWNAQSLLGSEIWSTFETGLNVLFVCFRYRVGVYSLPDLQGNMKVFWKHLNGTVSNLEHLHGRPAQWGLQAMKQQLEPWSLELDRIMESKHDFRLMHRHSPVWTMSVNNTGLYIYFHVFHCRSLTLFHECKGEWPSFLASLVYILSVLSPFNGTMY